MRSPLRSLLGRGLLLWLVLFTTTASAQRASAKFLTSEAAAREATRLGRQRLARNVHPTGTPTVTMRKFSAARGGAFVNVAFPVKASPGQPTTRSS